MNLPRSAAIILVAFFFVSRCSAAPINRDIASDRIGIPLQVEEEFGKVKTLVIVLKQRGLLTGEKADEVIDHVDVYWIYYFGANVAPANGQLDLYEEMVEMALREVKTIEILIMEIPNVGEWKPTVKEEDI